MDRPPMGWPKADELLTWAVAWRDYALDLEKQLSLAMEVIRTDREFVQELEQKDAEIERLRAHIHSDHVLALEERAARAETLAALERLCLVYEDGWHPEDEDSPESLQDARDAAWRQADAALKRGKP